MFADDPGARVLAAAVTEPLVALDARGEYEPRLAATVPTVENGGLRVVTDDPLAPGGRLVATFRIRDDARWQDGAPVTAQDVRYAYEVDAQAAPGSEIRWRAERIEAVDVIDDRYVRVTYRANERWDAYPLGPRALPRHVLAAADAGRRAAYAREPIHAGPFSVAAWIPGYGVTLAAFPGHVGGPPGLGRLEVRFFRDRTALLDALRRGDVDVAPSPGLEADLARTLDRFAEANRLEVYYTASMALDVLHFAPRGRFSERAVRRAVELTVDRQGIVDDVFAGRARLPRTYLVPPGWAASETGPIAGVDREAARGLLEDAGYRRGTYGIIERPGDRMIVTLEVAAGSAARLDAARRVAGDLAAVGIAVDVHTRAHADLERLIASGEFELALVPEDASDPARATRRWAGRVDPWFDVLSLASVRAPTRSDKRALYAELQRIWSDALPGLPLYQYLRVDIAARSLGGVQPPPSGGGLTWNAAAWRFAAP